MYNNPYLMGYNPQMFAQQQRLNMLEQQYPQFAQQQNFTSNNLGLQGKSVASLDVVKAIDIPLDGSISYFPISDGTAIITKQLQADGTTKTTVYKPVIDENFENENKAITVADVQNLIKSDTKELKEEIKTIKRQVRDLLDDLK